jgi:hypothetical protein
VSILDWSRPPKAMTTQEWQAISADSAPPGVWTPNMSREDALKWKARRIGGDTPRVEIRKTVTGGSHYAQLLVVVTLEDVTMSMNGRAKFSMREFTELDQAVSEAHDRLES